MPCTSQSGALASIHCSIFTTKCFQKTPAYRIAWSIIWIWRLPDKVYIYLRLNILLFLNSAWKDQIWLPRLFEQEMLKSTVHLYRAILFSINITTWVQKACCWKFTKKHSCLPVAAEENRDVVFHNRSDWTRARSAAKSLFHLLQTAHAPEPVPENFFFWFLYFSNQSILRAGTQASSTPKPAPPLRLSFASAFITWQLKKEAAEMSPEKSCTRKPLWALCSKTASVYFLVTSSIQASFPKKNNSPVHPVSQEWNRIFNRPHSRVHCKLNNLKSC